MEVLVMLEGMQQTYPGVMGAYPPPSALQGGFSAPFSGMLGSGVQGLFGNVGAGRPVDPLTSAYLQLAQQTGSQGLGNPFAGVTGPGIPQGIGQFGRAPLDPITAAYLQHLVQQQQIA